MYKKSTRVISLILCFLFAFSFSLSASALTVSKKQKEATYCTIVTCGDSIITKTSTVTFTNTSISPVLIEEVSESGCSSDLVKSTVSAGSQKTFKIKTKFGKSGKVKIKITSLHGTSYTYTITGKKTEAIGWSYN